MVAMFLVRFGPVEEACESGLKCKVETAGDGPEWQGCTGLASIVPSVVGRRPGFGFGVVEKGRITLRHGPWL